MTDPARVKEDKKERDRFPSPAFEFSLHGA